MANTDWFKAAKWGVFTHYLAPDQYSDDDWNREVDKFDVKGLAAQLESVGAPYYFITLGQNSGHYCTPNNAYDSIVGIRPSKCSKRDLVSDLYDVLAPKGIPLMVYLPSGAPDRDPVAMKALEWKAGNGDRLVGFQTKWEAVISEWAKRWGPKVRGWWFDGCYYAKDMYESPGPPNFQSLAGAAKEGCLERLVAFNPGVKVPVISLTPHEDYTAGEIADAFPYCPGPKVNQAQYHILTYLASSWGGGNPRFPIDFVCGYTKHVTSKGGVITWDTPITRPGLIAPVFIDQFKELSKRMKEV